jgi:hypothetical protein
VPLSIQKSVTKNCVVADSKISSQNVLVPIQKSAVMVESFPTLIYPPFFCVYKKNHEA